MAETEQPKADDAFDAILKALRDFNARCDLDGIPLLLKPKLLRLSLATERGLKADARVVRDPYFWDIEPSLLGVQYVVDPTLASGTWKLE